MHIPNQSEKDMIPFEVRYVEESPGSIDVKFRSPTLMYVLHRQSQTTWSRGKPWLIKTDFKFSRHTASCSVAFKIEKKRDKGSTVLSEGRDLEHGEEARRDGLNIGNTGKLSPIHGSRKVYIIHGQLPIIDIPFYSSSLSSSCLPSLPSLQQGHSFHPFILSLTYLYTL